MKKTTPISPSRVPDDYETIKIMIGIYCYDLHDGKVLCNQCQELLNYSLEKLKHCPLNNKRTTCGKCHIHCYRPDMKAKIREIMRYSGPRMLKRHPVLAIRHLIKGLTKTKEKQES